jgi:uncharacterized membrane protein YedE/YeeE
MAETLYWTWWQGGLGLAFVAIGYHLTLGKTFGFSGMWEGILYKRETENLADASSLAEDEDAFMAAMLAATEAAMAEDEVAPGGEQLTAADPAEPAAAATGWWSNLAFAIAVFLGGLAAAVSTDAVQLNLLPGPVYKGFFGDGLAALLILLVGGVMIGFGTRMGGGCTSGHGLNGCGRLQIACMVATASFFGAGIAVSWMLEVLL